jgi:hypothetical protein
LDAPEDITDLNWMERHRPSGGRKLEGGRN